MIATASMKDGALLLLLLRRDRARTIPSSATHRSASPRDTRIRRDGAIYNRHTLGDSKCMWLEWDSARGC